MRNGIAPVLYAYSQSILTSKFTVMLERIREQQSDEMVASHLTRDFYDLLTFVKPYEGNLWRDGGVVPDVRFYNEREWRFVAQLTDGDPYRWGMPKQTFLDEIQRTAANRRIAEAARIRFVPNDVKYLIVRREEEIVPLIKKVQDIKGDYSYDDVRLLSSRLISAEQIRSDF
jgi:hypothetical protein